MFEDQRRLTAARPRLRPSGRAILHTGVFVSRQMAARPDGAYVLEGDVTRAVSAISLRNSSVSWLNVSGCSIMGACPHSSMK